MGAGVGECFVVAFELVERREGHGAVLAPVFFCALFFSFNDGFGAFDGFIVAGDDGDFGDVFVAPVVFADGRRPYLALDREVEDLEKVADAAGENGKGPFDDRGAIAEISLGRIHRAQ